MPVWPVWLLRTSRLVEQVATFIGRLATLEQRRAVGAPVVESDTTRGPGSIHGLPQRSFEATKRFRHRLHLDRWAGSHRHRDQPSVAAAPLCGLFDTSGHARAFGQPWAHSGRITPGCT